MTFITIGVDRISQKFHLRFQCPSTTSLRSSRSHYLDKIYHYSVHDVKRVTEWIPPHIQTGRQRTRPLTTITRTVSSSPITLPLNPSSEIFFLSLVYTRNTRVLRIMLLRDI